MEVGGKPSLGISENFGGLNAARGQVRDEFAVGVEKIVLREFARQGPGDLLKRLWGRILCNLDSEEMDFKIIIGVRIFVAHASDARALYEGYAKFFAEFPAEGLGEVLLGADFATGELPFQRGSVGPAALTDEQAAIGAFNDGGDDLNHLKQDEVKAERSKGAPAKP